MSLVQTFTRLPISGLLIITGEIVANTSYETSDLIPIVSGASYRLSNSGTTTKTIAVCYYDSKDNYIVGFEKNPNSVSDIDSTAPLNAKKIRVCKKKNYDATLTQLTKTDEVPQTEPVFDYVLTKADFDSFNAKNVSLYINGKLVNVGDGFNIGSSIVFKPKSGYKILSITYLDADGFPDSTFTISDGGLTATDVYDGVSMDSYTFSVTKYNGTPTPDPDPDPESDYILKESDLSFVTGIGVLTINDKPATIGTGVNVGDTLKIIANNGVIIESVSGRDENGFEDNWTVTPDGKTASYQYWNGLAFHNLSIDTRGVQPVAVKGVNDIYVLNPDDMRTIITKSFKFFDGNETTDYSKYLIGLIEIPFNIPDDIIIGETGIQFGEYSTGVAGKLLNTDTLTVDMGSVTVTSDKGNFLDYANTTAVLFLPYSDPITLENEYVINETISIEYVVNLYDGSANVNISSTKNNSVIASRNVDLRASIPFGNVDSYPTNNSPFNIGLSGFNGISTPYIELLRNDAILEKGFFTIPIIDETELKNCSGFITVSDINLKTTATTQEKETIISQLNRGVII